MLHVEIVRNEWSSGRQRIVAKLVLNGTGAIRAEGSDQWTAVAMKPFVDLETGAELSAEAGEPFLRGLHRHLRGDYLFATEAHDEGECDYRLDEEFWLSPLPITSDPEPATG